MSCIQNTAKQASGGNRGIKEPPLLPVGHLGEVQPEMPMGDHGEAHNSLSILCSACNHVQREVRSLSQLRIGLCGGLTFQIT